MNYNIGKNNGKWIGGKPKCKDCGKEISYTSIKCRKCSRKRENNPNWRGGLPRCSICGKETCRGTTKCWLCHSKTCSGINSHNFGRHFSDNHRKNLSIARKGMVFTQEHRARMGSKLEKNYFWRGGISKKVKYSLNWTNTYREQIRQRDNYKCQICGCPQSECKRKLSVHHIDYNRQNGVSTNLISLCGNCHTKTSIGKREYWIKYFKELLCRMLQQR